MIACDACPCGLLWGASGGVQATPTTFGTVLGCTIAGSTAIGCNALLSNTGAGNTAVGVSALTSAPTGNNNTGIGACALCSNTTGVNNTAVGSKALFATTTGNFNVAVGRDALVANTTGCCNTVLGYCGACNLTTGSFNVSIGTSVQVASGTGSCQLAIGFSATCNWLTGNSTKAIQPGAGIIDCAGSCGTAGQVLLSNGSNAICWGTVGAATPTVAGLLKGCTADDALQNTALGCNALLAVPTGCYNTAIGFCAGTAITVGCGNTIVGNIAGSAITTGCWNALFGPGSGCAITTGQRNVALGGGALEAVTTGCGNFGIGDLAGCNITTGNDNVVIGQQVTVPNPTGCSQLAIGWASGFTWLTGDSSKNIQPSAGIKDCTASVGTAGQILSSTGTDIAWRSGCVQQTASCTAAVTLSTEITTRKLNNGDSLTVYNSNNVVPAVTITLTAAALTNYPTYPTQATTTQFTLPQQGSVTLVLADSATNTWYIESYDTPEQVGSVVLKATLSTTFVTPSTDFKVPFNVGTFNPQGYFNTTTSRFQPQVAGYYQVNAQLLGDAVSYLIAQVRKNGAIEIYSEQTSSPNTEATPVVGIVYLNGSSDYLEVWGNAGAVMNISSSTASTYFTASLINQTNTRIVGIDAAARMEVTAGTLPNLVGAAEVIPGVNGVVMSESFDPQNWFDSTTGRFTPTIPGYYQVNTNVVSIGSFANTYSGIFKNGVLVGSTVQAQSGTGNGTTANYSTVVFMNGTTDYLRLGAGTQGGTGVAYNTGLNTTGMSIALVGANQAQPIPPMIWISAGTVQSVGLGAINSGTGAPQTAPTITSSTQNNVRYRQIGPKEWEVQGVLVSALGTPGNGDYILTLPGGLLFDITSPYQLPYATFPNYSIGWPSTGLINSWVFLAYPNGTYTSQVSMVLPYDATRYRIFPVGPSGSNFWNSGFYQIGGTALWAKWGFTFFTP